MEGIGVTIKSKAINTCLWAAAGLMAVCTLKEWERYKGIKVASEGTKQLNETIQILNDLTKKIKVVAEKEKEENPEEETE